MIGARNANITLGGIFLNILIDVFFFPFWWYSIGLVKTVKGLAGFVADKEKSLGLGVWIKNIFVPMYGQRDIQGAIISFFVRLVQIIFRSLFLLLWIVIALVGFWIWIAAPIIIVYMIVWQLLPTA
jgi:hypothetical protein